MAINGTTEALIALGMQTELAKATAALAANGSSLDPAVQAQTSLTVTATTGTLPTPNGSVTIANAATPTVVELLEYCTELNAKVDELVTALKSTTS